MIQKVHTAFIAPGTLHMFTRTQVSFPSASLIQIIKLKLYHIVVRLYYYINQLNGSRLRFDTNSILKYQQLKDL